MANRVIRDRFFNIELVEYNDITIKNSKKTNNVNNAKKIYDLHIKNNI